MTNRANKAPMKLPKIDDIQIQKNNTILLPFSSLPAGDIKSSNKIKTHNTKRAAIKNDIFNFFSEAQKTGRKKDAPHRIVPIARYILAPV